jgi:aspartate/methionine/tyrosine aminotransferase
VAGVLSGHGVGVPPPPTAGFYLYPDFDPVRDVLAGAGIRGSDDLARALIDRHGVATLPGTAFGDQPERLTLRLATPMLYGNDAAQRLRALTSDAPASLPWIAAAIEALDDAIGTLLRDAPDTAGAATRK